MNINAWRGLAFENVCFAHIRQIKSALGISGVHTETFSWTFKGDETHDGTQIDMLIDRADRIINLCEIKFSLSEYTVTKDYDRKLRDRLQTFLDVARPKKAIHQTFKRPFIRHSSQRMVYGATNTPERFRVS